MIWRLRSSSSRAVGDNRINTCSFHPFYWWLLLLKEACALWCFLETVKRLFAIGLLSYLLSDEDASCTTLLFLGPQPHLAPLSGRRFLLLGSSADTFWGKGFLATALGTASPDRKKTHRGQKVWTSSGSERERESAHMEDLRSPIGVSVGGAEPGFVIFLVVVACSAGVARPPPKEPRRPREGDPEMHRKVPERSSVSPGDSVCALEGEAQHTGDTARDAKYRNCVIVVIYVTLIQFTHHPHQTVKGCLGLRQNIRARGFCGRKEFETSSLHSRAE